MLNNSKILITGGAGFVGSRLAIMLLNKYTNLDIVLCDNLLRTNSMNNVDEVKRHCPSSSRVFFEYCDITTDNIYSLMQGVDYVCHLAATRINRGWYYMQEAHNCLATGTFKVYDAAVENNVKKIYYASSASVYQGLFCDILNPIKEDSVCQPHTIYGAAKYYGENLLKSFNKKYDIEYCISRFFSVYGVGMDSESPYTEVIPRWINSALNKQNICSIGNPDESILDLVEVNDVCEAIICMLENGKNSVYNVCSGEGTSLRDLYLLINKEAENLLGYQVGLDTINNATRKDIEKVRIGCSAKLKSLGWQPKVSLQDGIKELFKHVQKRKG